MRNDKTVARLHAIINAAESAISAVEHGDPDRANDYLHDIEDAVAETRDRLALDVMSNETSRARAPKTTAERIALVRHFLDQHSTLRTTSTPVEWIMLKLSCTQAEAERLIAAVQS